MPIISCYTIIRGISLCHLTAAYYFLTAPSTIADQNVVFMLGESMRLPHATTITKPTEANAFIAILLAFIGIADLTAASLDEIQALEYWLSNVPMRLTFLFVVTAYAYLFKDGGMLAGSRLSGGVGELLQNSMVFTWGFMELALWFWAFTSLRDERQKVAQKIIDMRKAEEDTL